MLEKERPHEGAFWCLGAPSITVFRRVQRCDRRLRHRQADTFCHRRISREPGPFFGRHAPPSRPERLPSGPSSQGFPSRKSRLLCHGSPYFWAHECAQEQRLPAGYSRAPHAWCVAKSVRGHTLRAVCETFLCPSRNSFLRE